MKVIKKIILFALALIITSIGLFFGSDYIISGLVRKKFATEIEKLQEQGIDIHYDSLKSAGTIISIKGLDIKQRTADSDCSTFPLNAHVPEIELHGLKIFSLIFNKKLSFDSIHLDGPDIQFKENFKLPTKKRKKEKLKAITIGTLSISKGHLEITDSITCDTLRRLSLNLTLSDLGLNNMSDTFVSWSLGKMNVNTVQVELLQSFYTLTIRNINYNSFEKFLNIDSLLLIPKYDKHTFTVKTGRQTDRIVCVVPAIKAKGFVFEKLTKTKLHAESIYLTMNLEAFRDKRAPFLKKRETTLPVKYLHSLKFLVQVDTLRLSNSRVEYQEISEKGTQPGQVFFNDLNATINNISNYATEPTTMWASANFMGGGILRATFTFPSTPNKPYYVKGELRDFSLPKINPMLKPIASAEIDKGDLVEMNFHFKYNNDHSNGEVFLDYTGLKMSSIKRKNKKERKLISLLLNTFVRNNMDDNVSKAKKTGTILFYRDKKKSIFNYWWKSLLSGIKSVYNLDKLMDIDGKKVN